MPPAPAVLRRDSSHRGSVADERQPVPLAVAAFVRHGDVLADE